jgi:hypothetical protein
VESSTKLSQDLQQAYSLTDTIIDLLLNNIYAIIEYIPNNDVILNELARRNKPDPSPEELLDVIEFLLEAKKLDLDIMEIYLAHANELPFPYKFAVSTLLFAAAKYSKLLSTTTFEQFRDELLKTKYSKFAVRYPEIIRRIYNFIKQAVS